MEPDLKIAVDKDSADYRRLGANSLWQYIQEDIARCFGSLAVVIRGKLMYDPYLRLCYVKDFGEHGDEKKYLAQFEELIQRDIDFYSDIKMWIDKKRHYVGGLIGYYKDFKPTEWKDLHYPRMLCGRKSSGKTTILLFAKSDIEEISNFRCIYICLENPTPEVPWLRIKTSIIQQLDDLTLELSTRVGISNKDMVIRRHERIWRLNDAYPDPEDTPVKREVRDGLMNILFKSKHTVDFEPYLQDTIEFLEKSLKVKLTIFIDNIDRLKSDDTAKEICDQANNLAIIINVPIVVSIREETMAKLGDLSYAERISIIPPSFSKVLQRRLEMFLNDFKMDDTKAQASGYDTDKVKTFVKLIVESIFQKETYANLMAYHYDLDILLDVVKCMIKSPFLQPEYVLDLYKGNIPWHIVLDTMQRFQYRNFYDANSFLLNVYENDESPATLSNTLVRVRLLQVLRYRFKGLDKPIQLGEIYNDMKELGYSRGAVILALGAFARQRFIVTWQMHNAFTEDLREVLPQSTIVYYLDSLIYCYRYLQNIPPVTHVPFDLPMDIVETSTPIIGEKLKVVSKIFDEFIKFIRVCEEHEESLARNALFEEVTRGETLSDVIEIRLKNEIQVMKKKSKTKGQQ